MVTWKIYYDDGNCLVGNLNDIIPPERRLGVLVVVYREPTHEWGFWHTKDYYILFENGDWIGVDTFGLFDNILAKSEYIKYVLAGRTVPYEKFRQVFGLAQRECRPSKTGWFPGEK